MDQRWKYVFGVMWDYEFIPANVQVVERPDLLMYKTEGSTSILSNKIARIKVGSEAEFINRLKEVREFYGEQPHSWWVGPDSSPSKIMESISDYNYQLHDTYFGLVKNVDGIVSAEVPFEIRDVRNEQDVRNYVEVSAEIWGYDDNTRNMLVQQRLSYLQSEESRGGFLIAMDEDKPVGYAGYRFSSDGAAMYLAGTGVLEAYRGNGIYRALLAKRSEFAMEKGCLLIATQARAGTSEPILRRLGFEDIGRYDVLVNE